MNKTLLVGAVLLVSVFSAPNFAGSAEVNVTIRFANTEKVSAVRLYNFHLKRYQIIRNPLELTREDCLAYLPKVSSQVIKVFDLHISKGRTPYRALVFTQMALRNTTV